jgi:hypothetical protein
VVIVNWNTRDRLRDCLASLGEHLSAVPHEILVVDNDSSDGSAEMVSDEFPEVRLMPNDENVGFGRANNQAMRVARGDWFLLLNSDTLLTDDSVARLFTEVRTDPRVGVAQCRLILPDGRTQHSVYRFPSLWRGVIGALGLYKLVPKPWAGSFLLASHWDYANEREVDWVMGAFMLVPRQVFEQTGGFDESIFMYGEDMEWSYRISDKGWQVRYYPSASVIHFDHASSDKLNGEERLALCLRRQHEIYRARTGQVRGALHTGVLILDSLLHYGYYALRVRLGGKRADAYVPWRENARYSLRALLAIATGRQ